LNTILNITLILHKEVTIHLVVTNKKTVFELIITKEWVDGEGYRFIPTTSSVNPDETFSFEEALAVIAAANEITNDFVTGLLERISKVDKALERGLE